MEPKELSNLVKTELEQRAELNRLVMVHVLARCSFGKGSVKRGELNNHIYHDLGFVGDPGNHFDIYMHKLLQENGVRVSYSNGYRVYFGLRWKELQCQESKIGPDSNTES